MNHPGLFSGYFTDPGEVWSTAAEANSMDAKKWD